MGIPSDIADINEARSAYESRKTDSTVIAWICSPFWHANVDVWRAECKANPYRGLVTRSGVKSDLDYENVNEVSGEFLASTCHCHNGNGDPR